MTLQHIALARKWRPKQLSELVGQDLVVTALGNAIANNRLHHAYLFTGTRGVGKTTIARILAKCVNCESGLVNPSCGQCEACLSIDAGRFVDLIEIDAASKTKVEDTRDILDNVQYPPVVGRYKIYIIDEVHMLSGHSFNALLKTLEEPPEHVKFILATTDPEKLPITVLSRCLQFHLKPIALDLISQHLQMILKHEQVTTEPEAVELLATAAKGSLRDALSLLDQMLSYTPGKLTTKHVHQLLGTVPSQQITPLLQAIVAGDLTGCFNVIEQLASEGNDFTATLNAMNQAWHDIAKAQFISTETHWLDLAQQLTPEQIQLYYQIGIECRKDMPFAPTEKMGFEMAVLRWIHFSPIKKIVIAKKDEPKVETVNVGTSQSSAKPETFQWSQIIKQLSLKGKTKVIAEQSVVVELTDNHYQITIPSKYKLLFNQQVENEIVTELQHLLNHSPSLVVKFTDSEQNSPYELDQQQQQYAHQQAVEKIQQDPFVHQLRSAFDATVDEASIKIIS